MRRGRLELVTDDEIKRLVNDVADRISGESKMSAEGLRGEIRAATEDVRGEFRMTVEALRGDIRRVAEGNIQTREAIERGFADLREEISRSAAETHRLIHFVSGQVATHESAITDLQTRVGRLENSSQR